jgi:OOP family OmpA-OmpF porin
MKKLIFIAVSLVTFVGFSQEVQNPVNQKWTMGFGVNFIDNTSRMDGQSINSMKNWNVVPTVSKLSLERKWTNNYSSEVAFTFNNFSKDKLQNSETINSNVYYVALDASGKFYFDEYIAKNSAIDAYVIVGLGLNMADTVVNQTGNFGLGLNVWFLPNLGFRVQTIGKQAVRQEPLNNNHIQHSVEMIFKF